MDSRPPISRLALEQLTRGLMARVAETMQAKGLDYATAADALANFRAAAQILEISVGQAVVARLTDKLVRLGAIVSERASPDTDTVEDTYVDLVALVCLAYAAARERELRDLADLTDSPASAPATPPPVSRSGSDRRHHNGTIL